MFVQQGNGCRESWLWFAAALVLAMVCLASAALFLRQPGAQGQLTPQFGNADEYLHQPPNISSVSLSMEKAENSIILQVRGVHSGLVPSLSPLEGRRFETHPGSFIIMLNPMIALQ